MRVVLAIGLGISLLGCAAARERRAREYLDTELGFLVPYVDLDSEERAVREVLGQRKLIIDERLRGDGFVALSASTHDQKLSAVRIITNRGVVAAEDGDLDDLFDPRSVVLTSTRSGGPAGRLLLGIVKTQRGLDIGCAQFMRVQVDGNVVPVEIHLERFGSRACLSGLRRDADDKMMASVGWPTSAGVGPLLFVDLRVETGKLDQPEPDEIRLRIEPDDAGFVARETARLTASLADARDFAARQAGAVARAALSLTKNQSVDQQLGAYQSALGERAAEGPDAELVALTRDHIAHGWSDAVPETEGAPQDTPTAGDEVPDPREHVIIEPTPPAPE